MRHRVFVVIRETDIDISHLCNYPLDIYSQFIYYID
jgi:hypothetical protein